MSADIEAKLYKIPVVGAVVRLLKKVKLKAFKGLSVYDLLEMYIRGIVQGALSTRASAIAFSLFMALFPLLIFILTLIPFIIPYIQVGEESFDVQFLVFVESFLPTATADYFEQIFEQIKDQKRGGLLSSTFVISIFLMANGVNAIFAGFENSYHIQLTRNFFRQYLYALMVGLILSVLLILGAIAFVYFEFVLEYLSELTVKTIGSDMERSDVAWIRAGQLLFFVVLSYFTTAILYYFGTTKASRVRFFSPGALMTTILFIVTSYLFGVYVDQFASYNELYGALGGLLILMVFIWLNSNILLLGFELNASLNSLRNNIKKH